MQRGKRYRRGVSQPRRLELFRVTTITAAAIFCCLVVASGLQQFALRSPETAAVVSSILVDLANNDRSQYHVATLTVSPLLTAAAQAKADDMASKGYFAHTSPEGIDPWFWFHAVGYTFSYAGENLAENFSDSGDVNSAWMQSPEHRANILDPHFTQIGIATAQGMYEGKLTTFVVQEFGTPAASSASQTIVATHVPSSPTELAIARATSSVLGTQTTGIASDTRSATTASSREVSNAGRQHVLPGWGYVVGFPRTSLRIAYGMLSIVILFSLAVAAGFEWHVRHARKALVAGFLLVIMTILLVVADRFVFSSPTLTAPATATVMQTK